MVRQIPLNGRRGKGKFTIVDDEDYEWAIQWKLHVTDDGYVNINRRAQGTRVFHRLLALRWGWDIKDKMIDHIDHNRLNNTRENMRIANMQQNQQNRRGPQSNNTHGFLGVTKQEKSGWWACVTVNGQAIRVGRFRSPEEAARARDYLALKYHGEFATLNFPEEIPQPPAPYPLRKNNTSGYRGVSWFAHRQKWIAQIKHRDHNVYLGAFCDPVEAARAYDSAAKRYYGWRAKLNFPN